MEIFFSDDRKEMRTKEPPDWSISFGWSSTTRFHGISFSHI